MWIHAYMQCMYIEPHMYTCGFYIHCNYVLLFSAVEDQNFALFNYVNELNGEIEMVLKQIEQVSVPVIISACTFHCPYP